jgi:hypothetical protein
MTILDAALGYIRQGFAPIPIPHRQKGPLIDGWQSLRITAEDAPRHFNGKQQNLGIILGQASGGVTDIDLDCPEAIAGAAFLLPKTATFGHASKRVSHWIYKTNLFETQDRAAIKFMSTDRTGLLEARAGGGGYAAQTVFPPSTHVSGEPIAWDDDTTILEMDGAELLRRVSRLAAAAQIARAYPNVGGRHDGALVLGGFLTRCDFTSEEIGLFVEAVAVASGQPGDKRRDMIRTSKDGAASAKPAGLPLFAETFGKDVAKKCVAWLGYRGAADSQGPAGEPFETDEMRREAGSEEPRPFVPKYKDLAAFIREYQPISYTLEGILPRGVFYFRTARRSTGKTAFLIAALFAIILGNSEILGVKVKKGRIAYIALENPTDLRMKLAVARFHFAPAGMSLDDLADMVTIIDARLPVKEIVEQLTVATEELGHFQAVFWDTFQAGFTGDEFNDNAGILKYAQQLRMLTELPGSPSLLVAAHPTKNAGEAELIPYGGGSSINEADGNLTLWTEDGSIKLHFNRVRGPEFEPLFYRIEKLSSPDILDDEGRQILLPVLRPTSASIVENRKDAAAQTNIDLLKAMVAEPRVSVRQWARTIGLSHQTVSWKLTKLGKDKFVERGADDRWRLTKKGRAEVVTLAPETDEK